MVGELTDGHSPSNMVVAEQWPSALISVLALDLPIVAAFFPARFHRYFKPRNDFMTWNATSLFTAALIPTGVCLLLSGSVGFLERTLAVLVHGQQVIISVDMPRRGVREDRAKAQTLLLSHGLRSVFFLDSDNGGATDACHVFGFGDDLGSSILPVSDRGLARTVRHFLDGGTEGRFLASQRVLKSTIPESLSPPRRVLWHDDVVMSVGLFPYLSPGSRVYCPSHFFPTSWIAHPLSTIELLRLYQLPLSFDGFLGGLDPAEGLPFEDAPAPDLFTSIFRQLWGVIGGGSGGEGGGEGEEEKEEEKKEEEKVNDPGEGEDVEGEEEEEDCPKPCARPPLKPERIMTVERPDIHLVEESGGEEGGVWQFDFGDGFGCGAGTEYADPLTDEDTVTSCASEATLRGRGGVEAHERGGPIVLNPGPPFAVGDVIRSDVGNHGLQRAFVLRADHPRYQLRLADGTTVGTSTHDSWLQPRYATGPGNPNGFAPDQDDPFVDIRKTIVASRSRGGAQLESLRRIEEAKEYAKAVKADDADIPVQLWNDRVRAPGISK